MRFDPKTEQEIAQSHLPWPAGDYDFEVIEAEEAQSKKGNDMVKLTLHVFNMEGRRRTVIDYLVGTEGGQSKLRHFAEATGMLRQYETGALLASEMIGRTGHCKSVIQKDKSGQYADKNSVSDYLPSRASSAGASRPKIISGGDTDEDVPF